MTGSVHANALAIDATRTTKAAAVAATLVEAAACLMHATLDATMLVDRMAEAAEDVEIAD